MVKKRGGRRAKAAAATQEPPPTEGDETTPSTSQTAPQTPATPPPAEPTPPQSAWGQGPPRGAVQAQATPQQARGRGRGVTPPPTEPTPPKSAWSQGKAGGRGRGRGVPAAKPGGGASPVQATSPVGSEHGWGGARPKTKPEAPPQIPETDEIEYVTPVTPGTLGRRIKIETNHLRLLFGTLKTAYRYDVSFDNEKLSKRLKRVAMELFQNAYFPQNHPSYDGEKLLYSATRLPLRDDFVSGVVSVTFENDKCQEFHIAVKMTGTLDLTPLHYRPEANHGLLQKKNIGLEEAFQCIEVVFRQAYVKSFITVGRRFYVKPQQDHPLGFGAVMYLGGYQAAVRGSRPYLNIDVAHKAFTTRYAITDLLLDLFSTRNKPITNLSQFQMNRWQEDQMGDYLKGLRVVYEIPGHPGSKKSYKVNGLARPADQERFTLEGRPITVEHYFKEKWHRQLAHPNLPTLWVGNSAKTICLPMEYCCLKEGVGLAGARLNAQQTSKMIEYSAGSTDERRRKIESLVGTARHNANPCVQEFGFEVKPGFEGLEARVLEPPALEYSDGRVEPKRGSWWCRKFKEGARIQKWTIVGFGVFDGCRQGVGELARQIQKYGVASGMYFAKPEEPFEFIRNDKTTLIRCLEKKKTHDLIMVIIPNIKEAYNMVKQVAEVQIGCLTQCIKTDTLSPRKLNESTVRNILLKINSKMNGINHTLSKVGLITDKPCMVMGADVTHPSPQATSIPSVVAVTASYDLTATKYNISVYLQKPKTAMSEIIQKLEDITLAKLTVMAQNCKKEPERIYFYRDGVSDGEFDRVRDVEIAAIKRACARFRRGYSPKLTFLVVQKRHHTRFFPTDANSSAGDRSNNVPVGTCVDTEIVDQSKANFYLMSHQSVRGVGRPTKYCTLYDENGLSNDEIEILTFYLCHLYTRCTKSVSYPAPTYFAHLAAERAKKYLPSREQIDLDNLDQRLVEIKRDFASKNPMFFS